MNEHCALCIVNTNMDFMLKRWRCFILLCLCLGMQARAEVFVVEVKSVDGAAVKDAAVFLVPETPSSAKTTPRTTAIEQRDREFVPWVSVVQTGTSISFPNRDPILHHVYSFSLAKPFEIKLYSGDSPQSVLFDKPGVVTLGCNIHDWMISYIVIVDTPYFGKTGDQGRVTLRAVPAGRYQLRIWHPLQVADVPVQTVDITNVGEMRSIVSLELKPRKARYKPPLDRLKY